MVRYDSLKAPIPNGKRAAAVALSGKLPVQHPKSNTKAPTGNRANISFIPSILAKGFDFELRALS
jgi:hypothetical protein